MPSEQLRWGLEVEFPLVDPSGRPLGSSELDWLDLGRVLNEASTDRQDYWAPKYPGHEPNPYYMEGFDQYAGDGTHLALTVKGIEIRTGVCTSIEDAVLELRERFDTVRRVLAEHSLHPAIIGCNPTVASFSGPRGPREFDEWKAAEVTMATAGIHVNVGLPSHLDDEFDLTAAERRIELWAPMMAVFALNAPFLRGGPWAIPTGGVGKSSRSFLRAFYRVPLRAKPGQAGTRLHVSLYDSVPSLERVRNLVELTTGVLLSRDQVHPIAPTVRSHNLIEVARHGFAARVFDGNDDIGDVAELAPAVLDAAASGLRTAGLRVEGLDNLGAALASGHTYADDTLDSYTSAAGDVAATMREVLEYADHSTFLS